MTGDWGEKPDKRSIDEKTLEINDNKQSKNWQVENDKKPPNPVGTEEENRSAGMTGYYVFAFLFWVLVAAGRPHFCLVPRNQAVGGQTIGNQAIINQPSSVEPSTVRRQ